MRESDAADAALASGDFDEAARRYALAAELEEAALDMVSPNLKRTVGILGVSAATLWLEAGRFTEAIAVTERLLRFGGLDPYHRGQLDEIAELARGVVAGTGTDRVVHELGRHFRSPIRTSLQSQLARIRADAYFGADFVAKLYEEYGDILRRYIASIVPREDADEILDAVLIKFLTRRGIYDPTRGTLRMFLIAVARNECLAYLRRQRRFEELVAIPPDVTFDPTAALDARVTSEELLSSLGAPCKKLLTAYFLDGFSFPEIASQLGISQEAARKRVSRCLRTARLVYARLTTRAR